MEQTVRSRNWPREIVQTLLVDCAGTDEGEEGMKKDHKPVCRFCGWVLRPNPMCCWSAREKWEREKKAGRQAFLENNRRNGYSNQLHYAEPNPWDAARWLEQEESCNSNR